MSTIPHDDYEEDYEDMYEWCNYCQGSGYTYAPDYLVIEGIERLPCEHCEKGFDMVGVI